MRVGLLVGRLFSSVPGYNFSCPSLGGRVNLVRDIWFWFVLFYPSLMGESTDSIVCRRTVQYTLLSRTRRMEGLSPPSIARSIFLLFPVLPCRIFETTGWYVTVFDHL